jgi:hypothetical protein
VVSIRVILEIGHSNPCTLLSRDSIANAIESLVALLDEIDGEMDKNCSKFDIS